MVPVECGAPRVEQQLVGVEPVAALVDVGEEAGCRSGVPLLVVGPVGPPGDVAEVLAQADALDVDVPDVPAVDQLELLDGQVGLGVVEEQQLDAGGPCAVDAEVDPVVDDGGAHVLEVFEGLPVQRGGEVRGVVETGVVLGGAGRRHDQDQGE